ncbi:MAG: O-antigen ligase family protein, partial [Sphaerochaetaceae bacterium]
VMIQDGWQMFLENPLFGKGLNAFREIVDYKMYSHNNYIEILVSWGIVGFLWYYGFLVFLVIQGVKKLLSGESTSAIILSLSLLCTFFVDYLGRVHFYTEVTYFIYAFSYAAMFSEKPQTGFDMVTWCMTRLHQRSSLGKR